MAALKGKAPWLLAGGMAIALAVGGGAWIVQQRQNLKAANPLEKMTVPVDSSQLTLQITASGSIVPQRSVNLSPKAAGRLQQLLVEQGDTVQAGQIIAKMDSSDLDAQIAQAQARVAQVQARLRELQAGDEPREQARVAEDLQQSESQVVAQQAQVRQAEAQVQGGEAQVRQAEGQMQETQARIAAAASQVSESQAQIFAAESQVREAQAQVEDAQSQVVSAASRARLAQQQLERNRSLAADGAISRDRLDELVNAANSANADLKRSRASVDRAKAGLVSSQANLNQAQARLQGSLASLRQTQASRKSNEASLAQAQASLRGNRASLAQARAAQAQAEAATDNVKIRLTQSRTARRPEQIDQAKAQVQEAQAQVRALEIQKQDTIIRAPFAGLITQRYADPGAFVTPTTSASASASATSTSIVALAEGLESLANIPEVDISQIRLGQRVEIIADSYPGQTFLGKVRLIAPEAVKDQNVTSFQVRVALTSGLDKLRSGMNVDLKFMGDSLQNVLVVPTVAIVVRKGETGVLLLNDRQDPEFRPITAGATVNNQTQIIKGVKQGDRVFIDIPPNDQRFKEFNEAS